MAGRPSNFTPELAEAILADVEKGLFLTQVGLNNGVHPNTIRNWVRKGLEPGAVEPWLSFAERFVKAEVLVEKRLLSTIAAASAPFRKKKHQIKHAMGTAAGPEGGGFEETEELDGHQDERGDWHAAAFLLERRFPKRWGQHAAETSQRDALDVAALLEEAESRGQDLDDLLTNRPPELEEALLRNKDALLALLAAKAELPTAGK